MPFNVFLSHSSTDKPVVELARRLAKEGIQAWLDKWQLIPGNPWQPDIERAFAESETSAVFVAPRDFGPWQNEEMRATIVPRVRYSVRRFRVTPVLLPSAERHRIFAEFLDGLTLEMKVRELPSTSRS
jgi:hypothetical protein